jgi:2-polyprenyl-6-methoxyphenol hydroxylase-like FAD-dependent oxidoreductase
MHTGRHVVVVGAGIGGLTCALMLRARGIKCTVFEQAPQIRELGVGFNILPHAVAKLAALGLLDQLDANAVRTRELLYLNRLGQVIWRELRGVAAGYDVPQFSFHRGRLQAVLLQALTARGGVVEAGHKLVRFSHVSDGVRCEFETPSGTTSITCDALVGADGIHSVTRQTIISGADPTRWNGIIVLRGAAEWPKFLTGQSMLIAGGMKAKAVIYPIAQGATPDRPLTNWSLNIKVNPDDMPPPRREDWSRPGDRAMVARYAELFQLPQVDVSKLVNSTAEVWEFPMCDRDPLERWSDGAVTLLGDAAHPMYPTGSNGAGQAILDADCLATCLAETDDIAEAFRRYEQQRRPATAEIVRRNRIGGPENVIDITEERAPDGFQDIDDVLSFEDRKRITEGYASTAGFSLHDVNRR